MFTFLNQKEKYLLHIIEIQRHIINLYDKMNIQNKDTIEKKLNTEIQKENALLESLNIKEKNVQEIYKDFKKILLSDTSNDLNLETTDDIINNQFRYNENITKEDMRSTNKLILKRFENYIINKINPTTAKSNSKNEKINSIRNVRNIKRQLKFDQQVNSIRFLEELEENTNLKDIANASIKERNNLLVLNKKLEERYFSKNYTTEGYKELLNNGFDKTLVSNTYSTIIIEDINNKGSIIYNYENINNNPEAMIELTLLKADLYLLNVNEIKDIFIGYQTLNTHSNKESVKSISKCIEDTIYLKENSQNKVLKKVKY